MNIKITVSHFNFVAKLETNRAPITCQKFLSILPFHQKLVQARWSGESGWIPLGDFNLNVPSENQKIQPAPGEILFYSGGDISETEILFPYGLTSFACKNGPLYGNHFLTVINEKEKLIELGKFLLWQGAQEIKFEIDCSILKKE